MARKQAVESRPYRVTVITGKSITETETETITVEATAEHKAHLAALEYARANADGRRVYAVYSEE